MEQHDLTEEVFCLKYEFNVLTDVLLRHESERWVPGCLYTPTEHSHIERYKLACGYSTGKRVLDIACGAGKGTQMLATNGRAQFVSGFDLQPEAIRYATFRHSTPNNEFAVNDAQKLTVADKYDLAVSFETVEHLPDYQAFFKSISNSLKPGGKLIISTPIAGQVLDSAPANPFHVQEWGFIKFQEVLQAYFDIEKVYVQLYPQQHSAIPKQQPGIAVRAINKLKRLFKQPHAPIEQSNDGLSKIEEYNGQYNNDELGVTRIGYQIVVAVVKDV